MRLIDADAIPELFDKEYKAIRLLIEQGEEHLDNLAEGFTEAHHVIQKMPTIEAEPVKHGYNVYEKGSSRFECSECGYEDWDTMTCEPEHHNYCPNCGAKMDLEVDHAKE